VDILLDTVLLIERPDPLLLLEHAADSFHTSSISYAELAEGEFSPQRDVRLRAPVDVARAKQLYGEGLPFDDVAATMYRSICQAAVASGRQITRARRIDMMIAAIALANNCALATRNTADYQSVEELVRLIKL
jgi:predicted nucleic acid-binding protein